MSEQQQQPEALKPCPLCCEDVTHLVGSFRDVLSAWDALCEGIAQGMKPTAYDAAMWRGEITELRALLDIKSEAWNRRVSSPREKGETNESTVRGE